MELTDMEALKAAGACGFTDDGIPLRDAAFLYKAMVKAGELDVPISLHEEIPRLLKITASITALYLTGWEYMVHRLLQRSRWSRGTACLPSAPELML